MSIVVIVVVVVVVLFFFATPFASRIFKHELSDRLGTTGYVITVYSIDCTYVYVYVHVYVLMFVCIEFF